MKVFFIFNVFCLIMVVTETTRKAGVASLFSDQILKSGRELSSVSDRYKNIGPIFLLLEIDCVLQRMTKSATMKHWPILSFV